jgi:hypothetical protein
MFINRVHTKYVDSRISFSRSTLWLEYSIFGDFYNYVLGSLDQIKSYGSILASYGFYLILLISANG